jgi:Golgi nucleoside diphosphatase
LIANSTLPKGVSTFGTNPESVGPDHLAPLLEHALNHIPPDEVSNTPFFLLATAGMRLLPEKQRNQLLQEICTYVSENTKFQLEDCHLHVQVIPGETEGLYGWIAANYLLGGFDHPEEHNHGKNHHTYGFLDMGGASAQIAFAPNATEAAKHAEDLKLLRLRTIGGTAEEYKVFVTTWLGFGANEARRRYIAALESSTESSIHELPDPCLPSGLNVTESGAPILPDSDEALGIKPHLIGTGNFEECIRQTYPLLEKEKPCPDNPCLINGQHVPAIDFDVNHFVGVSEYWHTTHEIFDMGYEDTYKPYDFHTYQDRVKVFCSQPWDIIQKGVEKKQWGAKVDEQIAKEVCFKASWLINMLHDGIGIPRLGIEGHNATKAAAQHKSYLDPFQAVNRIKDKEVSWTLGKMLLYASSQIPPPDGPASMQKEPFLPVGFGTNTPGLSIPADFQEPGGKPFTTPNNLSDSQASPIGYDGGGDWHDTLFRDSPRRIPGFVLFLLIICVAMFFLCGRERRKAWTPRMPFLRRSGRRTGRFGSPILPGVATRRRLPGAMRFADKLFGRRQRGVEYERLPLDAELEAGDFGLQDSIGYEEEFEDLRGWDDTEGASSSRAGKTPGWATPTLNPTLGAEITGSPAKRAPGHFAQESSAIGARVDGLGVGVVSSPGVASAMDVGVGLVSRAESRERLTPSLGKSRTGSPFRERGGRWSPALGFKDKASLD